MQTRGVFPLWPRFHADLLGWVDLVPERDGEEADALPALFRHVAAVEEYWRRAVLEREAAYAEIPPEDCPDRAALRARLEAAFAATARLLDASLVDALAARPVRTPFPVKNALEALSLAYAHTVHHRAQIAALLRERGRDVRDWL